MGIMQGFRDITLRGFFIGIYRDTHSVGINNGEPKGKHSGNWNYTGPRGMITSFIVPDPSQNCGIGYLIRIWAVLQAATSGF